MKKLLLLLIIFTSACSQKKYDEKWELEKQNQILGNESVVENLKQNGDKFIVAREVFHWIYFKSEEDRKAFIKDVEKKNFVIVSEEKIQEELPFQLQIKRVDKVDIKNVNQYTLYLWELAKDHNGEYDGWETSIEK